jgi:glycosyltransferase involved in cell wall biosynthesis
MDWVIFGDDWSAHPSTTQHLIRNLPSSDRVIWINSIGMRQPKLTQGDARRALDKLSGLLRARFAGGKAAPVDAQAAKREAGGPQMWVIQPAVVPMHLNGAARALNRLSLARAVARARRDMGISKVSLLSSTPIAEAYIDAMEPARVGYLRLDDYRHLPGVDVQMIDYSEPRMLARADVVIGTARPLLPASCLDKAHYLPQGVSWAHFAKADLEPRHTPVLGFFGLMAEWLDHRLIVDVARRLPDWKLRFIGNQRFVHPSLREAANIELLPGVPFEALPGLIGDWAAGWIPFEISEITKGVNPLKVKEYLAAGLPTISTPMGDVGDLAARTDMLVSADAAEIAVWLEGARIEDTSDRRRARRESVRLEDWSNRSAELRRLMAGDQLS